jgi:hypothetical protein
MQIGAQELMLAIFVGLSLQFLPPPLRECAPRCSRRAVVLQQLRGGDLPADISVLISQLRDAEVALRSMEADGDTSTSAIATKSKLEGVVRAGVAKLRESGMADDQIMMGIMGPNLGQSPPAAPPPPIARRAPSPPASDPVSDRPLSNGVTNGVIIIRDKDGSIRPFVLIHGLDITDPSTGEGMADCVCMLNAPEAHKPSGFSVEISVNSIREVTQAMFVHVEESTVLGMLHQATDGAYGTVASTPPAINLPSYFK